MPLPGPKRPGSGIIYVSRDGEYLGYIRLLDTVKPEAKAALDKLDNENMLIISGNSKFVKPIRYQLLSTFGF